MKKNMRESLFFHFLNDQCTQWLQRSWVLSTGTYHHWYLYKEWKVKNGQPAHYFWLNYTGWALFHYDLTHFKYVSGKQISSTWTPIWAPITDQLMSTSYFLNKNSLSKFKKKKWVGLSERYWLMVTPVTIGKS